MAPLSIKFVAWLLAIVLSISQCLRSQDLEIALPEIPESAKISYTVLSPSANDDSNGSGIPLAGAFGAVFAARKKNGDQRVAIKVPRQPIGFESLSHYCDQMKQISKLIKGKVGSDHVMTCIENGKSYMVLEWAGKPGNTVLQKSTLAPALKLLKQVILALHALQGANPPIIHHDLKWDNVAVDENKCLKLIDLDFVMKGIWKERHKETVAARETVPPESQPFFCGLSPPQEDEAACPAAYSYDMFGAGIMSWFMCSLDILFFAKSYYAADPIAQMDMFYRVSQAHEHGLSKRAKLGKVGITNLRDLYGNRFKKHLLEFNETDTENIYRIARVFEVDVPRDILKLQACQQLGPDKLGVLESMTARNPESRPTPKEVLQSSLFRHVKTGCGTDPSPDALQSLIGGVVGLRLYPCVSVAIGTAAFVLSTMT